MFTKSCIIRKNTYELRLKLELIGYNLKYVKEGYKYLQISWIPDYVLGVNEEDLKYNDHISIDCGDNEELFLAIAALRDDTDKYQWFIYDSTDCVIENLWFICTEDKIEDMLLYDSNFLNTHKATLEEITEHFKQKDNNNDNARI